jgi:hypothetical protein
MKKSEIILNEAYEKQVEATEKLREIYECGTELTTSQRDGLLRVINSQESAALGLHTIRQRLKK